MQSQPGRAWRGVTRGALLALLTAAGLWLFAAGLRALPTPNPFFIALYSAAWILGGALFLRAEQRAVAERRQHDQSKAAAVHSERLAELIGALAQARTPSAAVEAALHEPVHALGADAGFVLLISRDGVSQEVALAVGYQPDERTARTVEKLAGKTPVSDAVGRGAPVMIESARSLKREYPSAGDAFATVAAVPLLVGSRVVAVVQLEFRRPRPFSVADRDYLVAIGLRAAQALDRTWQHESALNARTEAEALRRRADQELEERQRIEQALRASETRYRALAARTSRLHWFAAALSEAATLQAVARAVVEHGRNVLGAASGEVALLVEDGTAFETVYSDVPAPVAETGAHYPADPGLCSTDAVKTRAPILVGSFDEWQERYGRSAAIAADGGYISSATLPLLVDGRPVGVVAFHFTAPLNFDDDYRGLLVAVAQHCAQAMDRARLYEAAQQARAEAETANRHKDEFVSIVSHDLRAPLGAIIGWTSLLQQGALDPAASERALQSIADNASRQQHLVEELLDFSRIQSGRMTLDVQDVDLRSLLRAVVESNVPAAAGRGLQLEMAPVPAVTIRGDARRLEQVFFNVLGNALKFTPEGGRIAIAVRTLPDTVEIRVSDTGAGIDPDFLPHMFEAFRQGDAGPGRHGGVGLGLSIAKELVEAHNGRIVAESGGPGRGATFTITLPALTSEAPGSAYLERSPVRS